MYVSIPAWCDWEEGETHPELGAKISFNSSLVRLGVLADRHGVGGIKCFNSSLVRLGDGILSGFLYVDEVSIPAWCDWEFEAAKNFIAEALFQFQLGAIGSFIELFKAVDVIFVSIPAWCDWEILCKMNSMRRR